ncbi:MAG: hypothetical protein RTU92_13000 [Candidatus Thorarchaeota archaeon]
MSRTSRQLPKELAAFGERQFDETGATAVEILRVKAVTIRKHFKKLQGTTYLVAVISLDRIRVYFFNAAGVLSIAENIEVAKYEKIRKTSRLLRKFEKPIPPTPEELRMEATEDLRTRLSKAIRRVARVLATIEREMPDIYVTRAKTDPIGQSFGFHIDDDNSMILEESMLRSDLSSGLIHRVAFLAYLKPKHQKMEFAHCIGNGMAYSLFKDKTIQAKWRELWTKASKDTEYSSLSNHFIIHRETYLTSGYRGIFNVFPHLPAALNTEQAKEVMRLIHDETFPTFVSQLWQNLMNFCGLLDNPYQLAKKKRLIDSIHLAPRVLVDPSSLGVGLVVGSFDSTPESEIWFDVKYRDGNSNRHLVLYQDSDSNVESINYWLDPGGVTIEDKSSVSRASHSLHWIRRFLGKTQRVGRIDQLLNFEQTELSKVETAVMERLLMGELEILANTLVGSTNAVKSLIDKGRLVLLPDFNHLGFYLNYYLTGMYDEVLEITKDFTREGTVVKSQDIAHAVVSSPLIWEKRLLEVIGDTELSIYPIIDVKSKKRILRDENLFPPTRDILQWSDGPTT